MELFSENIKSRKLSWEDFQIEKKSEKISSVKNISEEIVKKIKQNLGVADELNHKVLSDIDSTSQITFDNLKNISESIKKVEELLISDEFANSDWDVFPNNKDKMQKILKDLVESLYKSNCMNQSVLTCLNEIKKRFSEVNFLTKDLRENIEDHFVSNCISNNVCWLTQLPNKDAYNLELNNLLQQKEKFHVILIDLNNFKEINDTFGYLVWDSVLAKFAERLKSRLLTEKNKVFRWWGDEFVVLSFEKPVELLSKVFRLFLSSKNEPITFCPFYVEQKSGSKEKFNIDFSSSIWYFDSEEQNYSDFFNTLNKNLLQEKQNWKCCPFLKEIYKNYNNWELDIENSIKKIYSQFFGEQIWNKWKLVV